MFKKPFTAAALIILGLVAVLHVDSHVGELGRSRDCRGIGNRTLARDTIRLSHAERGWRSLRFTDLVGASPPYTPVFELLLQLVAGRDLGNLR